MSDSALQQAADLIRAGLPESDWRRADLVVRMLTEVEEYQLTVFMADGSMPELDPAPELAPLFRELRSAAFTAETGTWYSARLTVDRRWPSPGFVWTENFDADPGWLPPLPAEAYWNDLRELFGEAVPVVPRWLAELLWDGILGLGDG